MVSVSVFLSLFLSLSLFPSFISLSLSPIPYTLTPPPLSFLFPSSPVFSLSPHYPSLFPADGHVWSWGANLNGALGRNGTSDSDLIGQIEGVDDISFTNISAGDGFSVAVSSEGTVYTWGSNTKGQLGRETTEEKEQILPTKVSIPTPIIDISTGRAFSFAVGKDGSVYSWGSGQHGVLGHGDTKRQKTPKKVEGVTSVQHVDCGVFHAALITEKGQVFVVGSKNDGRIGL